MTTALIIALTYWVIYVVDESFSWQALVRPIVTGPIVGLVLGDIRTGIIMGGSLEAIYLGVVSIGGGAPADAFGSTIICVTFVISGGLSMEAGLALAYPIGTLTARIPQLILPLHAFAIGYFEKFAALGDSKSYLRLQRLYRFVLGKNVQALIIFFAVWIGADRVSQLFDILPAFVLNGLVIAGALLPALGLGILTSMIFTKELGAFLFIGFVLSAYLGLDTMAVAILAGSIAVLVFFMDSQSKAKQVTSKNNNEHNDEEEFFS